MEEHTMKIRFEIKGLYPWERKWAEKALFDVYDMTAKAMNNGGIDKYNAEWYLRHPEEDSTTVLEVEYTAGYEELFKMEADKNSRKIGVNPFLPRIAKLRQEEPLLFKGDLTEGTFYGYVEHS